VKNVVRVIAQQVKHHSWQHIWLSIWGGWEVHGEFIRGCGVWVFYSLEIKI